MDNKKLFIGNVNYDTTIEALVKMASEYGEVVDSYKPLRKGFAFITFATEEAAQKAIEGMNGKEIDGRALNVSIAQPREDKPRGDFRGGFGGNRGGFRRDDRGGYGRDRR